LEVGKLPEAKRVVEVALQSSYQALDIKLIGTRGFEPRTPTVSRCFGTLRTARIRS
jgi:hypothetical protein